MKKLILSITLALTLVFVSSAIAGEEKKKDTNVMTYCKILGDFAYDVMNAKQKGVSLITIMEKVKWETAVKPVKEIILGVYDSPRYSTERYQKEAKESSREKYYLQCVKSYYNLK